MRVVRQQGILEYLVARDGLFTIQNIFSLLQFLDFFNISGIKGFEDLQSCIEHHVKEKPTWQLLKPRVRNELRKWQKTKGFYTVLSYLIFVIFFTRAKFLENKIYTEKRQFFALNL